MSNVKTFKFNVSDHGKCFKETIEAVNRPQAIKFAEARYPGCRLSGFNQV